MIPALVAIAGMLCGSFLNVLIYRLPRDQSPWSGRSRCPQCGRVVRWFENIPVLSWLALRGRCAGCRQRIHWRYPLVELLTAGVALLCWFVFGSAGAAVGYFIFLAALLAIAWIDWEHMIIPDELSIGVAVLGLVLAATVLPLGLKSAILGALVGAGFIQLVAVAYRRLRGAEGMGFGDVKMAGMIGAFLGPVQVLLTIFVASFLGSLFGVVLLSRGGTRRSMVAFGTFLAASAALCLFFGNALTDWYRSFLQG